MTSNRQGPIRVFVVDDSALVRKTVRALLEVDGEMSVVGTAADGREALVGVGQLKPDVVTLDISMPEMDGLTCLGHLVREHRQPVVMLSTLATENSFPTFKALALGAVDFVTKPGGGEFLPSLEEVGRQLRAKVRVAADVCRDKIGTSAVRAIAETQSRPSRMPPAERTGTKPRTVAEQQVNPDILVGVGGSTGGASGLEAVLRALPPSSRVAVVAVQHLPPGFTESFARYLDSICDIRVHEARDAEVLHGGHAYLAPGGSHLRVQPTSAGLVLRIDCASPPQHGYRPAIDQLFYSLATARRGAAVGVLLSGMGSDGVRGLLALRKLGGVTLVQDEATSVVFDMPRRAMEVGAAQQVLALESIPRVIERIGSGRRPHEATRSRCP